MTATCACSTFLPAAHGPPKRPCRPYSLWNIFDGMKLTPVTQLRFEPELSASDLAILDDRQRKVLALRAKLSFQSISQELGVSKERVRQIQNRAIEKLIKRIPGLRVVTTKLNRK